MVHGVHQAERVVLQDQVHVLPLSPDADCISDVIFAVGKLPDAVVDGNTALARGEVLLCHFHPPQRAHSETLGFWVTVDATRIIIISMWGISEFQGCVAQCGSFKFL